MLANDANMQITEVFFQRTYGKISNSCDIGSVQYTIIVLHIPF